MTPTKSLVQVFIFTIVLELYHECEASPNFKLNFIHSRSITCLSWNTLNTLLANKMWNLNSYVKWDSHLTIMLAS